MIWGPTFTGLGYATGISVFWILARKRGLRGDHTLVLAVTAFVCGTLGAKVTQALVQGSPASALDPSVGGRALLGGLVAGWIGFEVAKAKLGLRSSLADAVAPALAAGEAVGRIGCHFNTCCYGTAFEGPWSVRQHGLDRHPAQFYSALFAAVLFVALTAIRRSALYPGATFHAYLALWGAGRFGLEFFRERDAVIGTLGTMQLASLETAVAGTAILAYHHLRRRTVGQVD